MSNKEPLDLSKLTKKDLPIIKELDRDQEDMLIKLFRNKRVIVNSCAGSGKTTVATQGMKALLDKGYIDHIYYVVFPVQEDSLGFLPGGVSDKIAEYAVPFIQALMKAGVNPVTLDMEAMSSEFLDSKYKIVPHTFLRGRNLERSGVILDEAQNAKLKELQKTLTRLEDDCYMAMLGHSGQIDIEEELSGYETYIYHFMRMKARGVFKDIEFADLRINHRGQFSRVSDSVMDTVRLLGEKAKKYNTKE